MIASERLAGFIASPQEQAQSQARVDAFVARWSHMPPMVTLERDLRRLQDPEPAAVLELARGFMDHTAELQQLVDEMIAQSQGDPFFRPPFHPATSEINVSLLIFHSSLLSIAMGVTGVEMLAAKKAVPNPTGSVGFTGHLGLFRFLKAGDAELSLWEAPPISGSFSAAQAAECRQVGRRRLRDGDELVIDGARESFIIEHASSDMVYLQAMVRCGAAPLAAEFDHRTRQLVSVNSTDEVSSRVQMMATLLRSMGRDDAAPLIAEFLSTPHFYTRWYLMRELLAMDAEFAQPHLQTMALADPHPEVRAAAAQTLRLFFDETIEIQLTGEQQCPA